MFVGYGAGRCLLSQIFKLNVDVPSDNYNTRQVRLLEPSVYGIKIKHLLYYFY